MKRRGFFGAVAGMVAAMFGKRPDAEPQGQFEVTSGTLGLRYRGYKWDGQLPSNNEAIIVQNVSSETPMLTEELWREIWAFGNRL